MKKSVDFIGVGTGPFNLSIAALSHQIEELNCLFFDEHPHFSWHPGMLVPDCLSERSGQCSCTYKSLQLC